MAKLNREPRMSDNTPGRDPKPPSFGNTLFLSGACIVLGSVALLIGLGVIPTGNARSTPGGSLIALAAGGLFVFAGLMVLVRDLGGARNNEELPADAPAFLRFSASLLNILLLAVFAAICSMVALGMVPGLPMLFRIFMGAFALLLWYGVIYLTLAKAKRGRAGG